MSEPIKEGSVTATIVAEEEALHRQVQERISAGHGGRADVVGASDLDRDLIELRDAIAEAKPEDLAPLVEQMTRLAAIRSRLGQGKDLPVDVTSPYFAHMVLKEGPKTRDVLIGKRGFIDRKSNVQIVDWRNAPISQVYYRYEEGDDYDEEIGGLHLSGDVVLKRNLSIQASILRRIGSPQGTMVRDREGIWHEAAGSAAPVLQGGSGTAARAPKAPTVSQHGKSKSKRRRERQKAREAQGQLGVHGDGPQRADKHLPEIAALIDKEQFDLITQPESGMIVIQGGAGSGKTTVALHRIAYLNFADRQRFRSSKILFVVPSQALARYVEGVLPSLGVRGVPVVTYTGWARATRNKVLRGTKGRYNDNTPDTVSRLKKHAKMLPLLDEYVREQVAEVTEELECWGEECAPIVDQWESLSKMALVPRLRNLYRWVSKSRLPADVRVPAESKLKGMGRRANDIMEDWAELLTDKERLMRHLGEAGVKESSIMTLIRWCIAQQDDPEDIDRDSSGTEFSSVDGHALSEGSIAGRFDYEDDPLLLRLVQLKRGALVAKGMNALSYAHVAIDEAQDRSAVEVKVLLDATETESAYSKDRSVTIAGDTAQRVVFDNGFEGWEKMLEETGNKSVVVRPLKLSYRSTAEVMALAREILGPELAPAEPLVARSGAPVELHQFGDTGEAVAFLADALRMLMASEPSASVALLTRYPEQADLYYAGLRRAEVPRLRRVKRDEFTFNPGIDVTDAGQVKGLEFDYVIMLDVNASTYPATVECRHLLHIAATRAAYQLWLLSTGDPSPLLPDSIRLY